MKKSYSKAELEEMAKGQFANLSATTLFATSDGQFFLLENRARMHAGKGAVHTIVREDSGNADLDESPRTLSVDEIKDVVGGTDSIEELEDLLDEEVSGKNRKTAVKVIQDKIDQLTKSGE